MKAIVVSENGCAEKSELVEVRFRSRQRVRSWLQLRLRA
jgi:hypothetical protein